jgi:UDP:flavonoid glycosyltransferase YjiC (YdhE family)
MSWAPTNRWVRGKLEAMGLPVPIEEEDWRPAAGRLSKPPIERPKSGRLVVGRISAAGAAQWPKTIDDFARTYAPAQDVEYRSLGAPPRELLADPKLKRHWTIFDPLDTTVERFLARLDALAYFPGAEVPELPDTAIATAMAAGKVVALPPRLRPHYGPGALYCEPQDVIEALRRLFADPEALSRLRDEARYHAEFQFSRRRSLERVQRLAGPPSAGMRRVTDRVRTARSRRPRVLFVPSNGIGLGHAARLLAIARRLDKECEPVFATLGQAAGIVASFGYGAEYLPSYSETQSAISDWDSWLRFELAQVIARHDPAVLVYDGNNPTPGLIGAAEAHGTCHTVWVRRGMYPDVGSPYLDNARLFDCVIEPGEYAGERDTGPTADRRHEVRVVPPIRLLEPEEMLSSMDARKALGLDPERPAVLVQLGGGGNRDVFDLADRVVSILSRFHALQIAVAEWGVPASSMPQWPDALILRGFPLGRYFAAFDLSVASAGYNTFHEVIAAQLPTIFIANRHPAMDNQAARAAFAQDHGAGFDLAEDELHLMPALVEAMLNPQANAFMRRQCAAFDRTNGAGAAAEIIKCMTGIR